MSSVNEALFNYRARCLRVIDGDTVDLQVDLGFHMTASLRFRLLGVDAPELHAKDLPERERAVAAKQYLVTSLLPTPFVGDSASWPLLVHTEKADSFGRWLADVWIAESGVSVGGELMKLGHAAEYRR